jgi:hypothetical protein
MKIYRYTAQRQGHNGQWFIKQGYTIAESEDVAINKVKEYHEDYDYVEVDETKVIEIND